MSVKSFWGGKRTQQDMTQFKQNFVKIMVLISLLQLLLDINKLNIYSVKYNACLQSSNMHISQLQGPRLDLELKILF